MNLTIIISPAILNSCYTEYALHYHTTANLKTYFQSNANFHKSSPFNAIWHVDKINIPVLYFTRRRNMKLLKKLIFIISTVGYLGA